MQCYSFCRQRRKSCIFSRKIWWKLGRRKLGKISSKVLTALKSNIDVLSVRKVSIDMGRFIYRNARRVCLNEQMTDFLSWFDWCSNLIKNEILIKLISNWNFNWNSKCIPLKITNNQFTPIYYMSLYGSLRIIYIHTHTVLSYVFDILAQKKNTFKLKRQRKYILLSLDQRLY